MAELYPYEHLWSLRTSSGSLDVQSQLPGPKVYHGNRRPNHHGFLLRLHVRFDSSSKCRFQLRYCILHQYLLRYFICCKLINQTPLFSLRCEPPTSLGDGEREVWTRYMSHHTQPNLKPPLNCIANFQCQKYTPEVLPSAHRATGNGIAVGCNRIMGIISAVVASTSNTATVVPIYICAALYLAMAGLAAVFPFEPYGRRSS